MRGLQVVVAVAVLAAACGGPTGPPVEAPVAPESEPAPVPSVVLDVLAYNVWFLPMVSRDDAARVAAMGEHLDGYDVLVLSEAFDDARRSELLADLAARGYHATPVLGATYPIECRQRFGPLEVTIDTPVMELNGGVVVLGRGELEQWEERVFHPHCAGEDCCAAKGVMYARFRAADGRCLHVFGTHLQNATPVSPSGPDAGEVRWRQLEVIRGFMDETVDLAACPGPVVVAGDLNVRREELPEAARILRARTPDHFLGPRSHGEHNVYAGGDHPKQLDYVLLAEESDPPVYSSNETRIFRASHAFSRRRIGLARERIADLSDHHPVAGHFEWGGPVSRRAIFYTLDPAAADPTCIELGGSGRLCGRGVELALAAAAAPPCAPLAGCDTSGPSLCADGLHVAFCPAGLQRPPCADLDPPRRCVQLVDPDSTDPARFDDYLCYRGAERPPFGPSTGGCP